MTPYLALFIASLIFAVWLLLRQDRQDQFRAFVGVLCLGAWQLELHFLSVIKDLELVQTLFHLTRPGMFFIPFAASLYTYYISRPKRKWFLNCFVRTLFFLCLSFSVYDAFINPTILYQSNGVNLAPRNFVFTVFVVSLSYSLLGSLFYTYYNYKFCTFREKNKIRWLVFSLVAMAFLSALTLLKAANENYLTSYFGAFSNALMLLTIYFVSVSKELFSIRLTLLKIIMCAIELLLYFCFYQLVINVEVAGIEMNQSIVAFSLFVISVFLLRDFIHGKIVPLVCEKVIGGYKNYTKTMDQLGGVFKEVSSVDVLLSSVRIILIQKGYASEVFVSFFNRGGAQLSMLLSKRVGQYVELCELDRDQLQSKISVVTFKDEISSDLLSGLPSCDAILPIFIRGDLVACFFICVPNGKLEFSFGAVKVFQWVSRFGGKSLAAAILHSRALFDLTEANKKMTLLDMIGQYNHDIKAPLSIIESVIDADVYSEEKKRRIIFEQLRMGEELIATMSKLIRGSISREVTLVDLRSLVKGCVLLFEKRFSKVDCYFKGDAQIMGSEKDLKLLFVNLIKNAAEAVAGIPNSKLEIRVIRRNFNVYFQVSDNGCGLDSAQLDNIFSKPFSTKSKGEGLGLQIVKRIIEEHSGYIQCATRKGGGAAFTGRLLAFVKQSQAGVVGQ